MKWPYFAISYAIALAFFAAAIWLTWDWYWALRLPLLAYLGLCTFVFPLSRVPADMVVAAAAIWSPIEVYGIIVWAALAVFYLVVWALGIVFAPIGALIRWAGRRAGPGDSGTTGPG